VFGTGASREASRSSGRTHVRRAAVRARRLTGRLHRALEARLLTIEQERGVLGPAHRRWSGNSPAENRTRWDQWDWSARGEEWNASNEWKEALIEDVLERWLPARGVALEIGPGGGRWTEALLARASRLFLVDVSQRPLDLCRQRFAHATNITYVLTPGSMLPGVGTASIDGIWCFDVFVHVAPRDQAAYLTEIARGLAPGGVAVIHHADGRNRGRAPSRHGWRAPMSRRLFAALASARNLQVEAQFDSWGPDGRDDLSAYADAITVLRRSA
jgi:SAM-dependent methyltransferase